ncbi:hypothetical protein [uncultured Phascolarctobacterium sp.]|uniref:hypothetical protein n=1 Tax=uncultured Phascolarctobacterium sp. TaxID=512296 RepID=UPI0025E3C4C6|nr:hypothetical protein [uncultured Phascolarctobacterium sp.]
MSGNVLYLEDKHIEKEFTDKMSSKNMTRLNLNKMLAYVLQQNDFQTEYKMSRSLMLKILAIALLAPLGYIAFLRDTEFFPNLLLLWAGLMFLGEMLNEAIDEDI